MPSPGTPSWLPFLTKQTQYQGAAQPSRGTLNFGSGFSYVDDPTNDLATVTAAAGPTLALVASATIAAPSAVRTQSLGQVATAVTALRSQPFHGLALAAVASGASASVQTAGPVARATHNAGAGVACAAGVNAAGVPVRATDPTCVSAPNWIGTYDTDGTLTINPRRATHLSPLDFGAAWDGTTDDAVGIQACLNSAATVKTAALSCTVNAAGKTYTRASGSFVGENVLPGMALTVAGCSNPANNGIKTVASVTDLVVTVNETCASEGPTASVTMARTGGGDVRLPAGTALVGASLFAPMGVNVRGAGKLNTRILANFAGQVIVQRGLKNSGGEFDSTLSDFMVDGGGVATIGIYSFNAFFSKVSHVKVRNCFDGFVTDQSEIFTWEGCVGELNTRSQFWIVNGPDVTAGASAGFSNQISMRDCQANLGQYGLMDDGGYDHDLSGNNWNGQSISSMRLCGVQLSRFSVGDVESAGIHFETTTIGGVSQGGCFKLTIDHHQIIGQSHITAANEVTFERCTFASHPGAPAITGVGNAGTLNLDDCSDDGGYGLLDGNPLRGRIGAWGGPAGRLILGQANRPTFIASSGDYCWNRRAALDPVVASGASWTVDATGKTYTAGSGNLFTDGFEIGMLVTMAGFTNSGNNGTKTIVNITSATQILVAETLTSEGPTSPASVTFTPEPYMAWVCQGGSDWRPSGPVWTPASVQGLAAWFDAAHAGGVDGSNLATWPDRSRNAFNLTVQTGTNVYHASGGANGKPYVTFATGPLRRAVPLVSGADAARTFFVVLRRNSDNHVALLDGKHGTGGIGYGFGISVNSKREVLVAGVANEQDTTSNATASWEKATLINTGAASQILRVNGAAHTLSAGNACGAATTSFALGGNDQVFQADQFNGDIAEFLGYAGVLSASEIAEVETYLFRKYGV